MWCVNQGRFPFCCRFAFLKDTSNYDANEHYLRMIENDATMGVECYSQKVPKRENVW